MVNDYEDRTTPSPVTPVKTGVHVSSAAAEARWIPACAGMTSLG
jgi:hypothetical protein